MAGINSCGNTVILPADGSGSFLRALGKQDRGTDSKTVALGELEEETGFRAISLIKLGHLFEAYGYSSQGMHVFLATELEPGRVNRDREEQDMITAAFSRKSLTEIICSGEITDAATVAALGLLTFYGYD